MQRGTSLLLPELPAIQQRRQSVRKWLPTQLQEGALFGLLPTRRGGASETRPNCCWKRVLRPQQDEHTAEQGLPETA